MQRIETLADATFRREIADLIIQEAGSPDFTTQAGFAKWTRQHKKVLVSLFGGQGIQNLARVVAWIGREQAGKRRQPAEVMSRYADLLLEGEPAGGYVSLDDMVRAALLDRATADALLRMKK